VGTHPWWTSSCERPRQPDCEEPQGSHSLLHVCCLFHLPLGFLTHARAKVDNAATAQPSGLKWFKVYQDGLDGSGQWGVDRMISSGGWQDFTLPQCIAPGQYLLRAEIIALHSASKQGAAQFYMGCAQINVSGSGTTTGSQTVSFPGAYSASDPGILVSIYNKQGQPTGNGTPYQIPGPAVMTC
jgi:lytic cellulose monooxygenase (C1-hydroxylating)